MQGFDKAIVEMAQNCVIPDGSRTGQPPDMSMDGHLLIPSGIVLTPSEREVREEGGMQHLQRLERTARKELKEHDVAL